MSLRKQLLPFFFLIFLYFLSSTVLASSSESWTLDERSPLLPNYSDDLNHQKTAGSKFDYATLFQYVLGHLNALLPASMKTRILKAVHKPMSNKLSALALPCTFFIRASFRGLFHGAGAVCGNEVFGQHLVGNVDLFKKAFICGFASFAARFAGFLVETGPMIKPSKYILCTLNEWKYRIRDVIRPTVSGERPVENLDVERLARFLTKPVTDASSAMITAIILQRSVIWAILGGSIYGLATGFIYRHDKRGMFGYQMVGAMLAQFIIFQHEIPIDVGCAIGFWGEGVGASVIPLIEAISNPQ